jgi:glycosyltransferase involved in cell wall biosynthesis
VLKIVWSGMHEPGKGLPILLKSLSLLDLNIELHVLGNGSKTKSWQKLANTLDIANKVIWYGWIPREEALKIMKTCHLSCITSLKDLTSTVTLESLSFGLPIICLDHCGFSHVVNESCGIKIPLNTPKVVITRFAEAITTIYLNEDIRFKLSQGAIKRSKDFNWGNKILHLNQIYNSLAMNYEQKTQ